MRYLIALFLIGCTAENPAFDPEVATLIAESKVDGAVSPQGGCASEFCGSRDAAAWPDLPRYDIGVLGCVPVGGACYADGDNNADDTLPCCYPPDGSKLGVSCTIRGGCRYYQLVADGG